MTLDVWLSYVGTVVLLMSTPGPSQLLMVSSSLSHGPRRSLATAAGDLSANTLQMLAAGFGIGVLVLASDAAFLVVKGLGVVYLLAVGIATLRRSRARRSALQTSRPLPRLWVQGFVTSATNPKAVVFFAALFPHFIDPRNGVWAQLGVLMATYLVLDGAFLTAYGWSAAAIARRTDGARAKLDLVAGGLLIAAAVLLALKARPG